MTRNNTVLTGNYEPTALQKMSDTQHKVIEYQKKNKIQKLFPLLFVLDDMAEDQRFIKY